jgi:hypothetical protein
MEIINPTGAPGAPGAADNDDVSNTAASRYRVVRITGSSAKSSNCNAEELITFFESGSFPTSTTTENEGSSTTSPENKLFKVYLSCVHRNNGKIHISDRAFDELLRSMNAGRWVTNLIKMEYMGFFHQNEPGDKMMTFLAGADWYQILWTMPTTAGHMTLKNDGDSVRLLMFIHPHSDPHSEAEVAVREAVEKSIEKFIGMLKNPLKDISPIYLPFITLAQLDIEWRKTCARDTGLLIEAIEKETGTSPPSSLLPYKAEALNIKERSISETIRRTRELGQQIVQITASLGNAEAVEKALEYVEKRPPETSALKDYNLLLQQQLESTIKDLKRLQERVKTQQSVVRVSLKSVYEQL